jgi:hypothetical protein
MTDEERIKAAVRKFEDEGSYLDIGLASIPDTVEQIIEVKPEMSILRSRPSLAVRELLLRLDELPRRDYDIPRIAFFVVLGRLGREQALPVLAKYISGLPDEAAAECHHITHPFRYALRAIERLAGCSLGLGPGEDLRDLFRRRRKIARQWLNER